MPLHRRDSWPPTTTKPPTDTLRTQQLIAAIDENPFAFFLTSPDDPDDLDIDTYLSDDDLNAGIETPDSSHSPIREISPSSLQRHPLPKQEDDIEIRDSDDDEEYDFGGFGIAIPLSLKEFTQNTLSGGRKSRTQIRDENENDSHRDIGLGINLADFSARGRARVKLTPPGRGRGYQFQFQNHRGSRSLSARRPSSWRAPSPEIFSIKEERESDEEEKGNGKREVGMGMGGVEGYSMSAPATSRIGMGGLASPGLKPKEKKRVHWAI